MDAPGRKVCGRTTLKLGPLMANEWRWCIFHYDKGDGSAGYLYTVERETVVGQTHLNPRRPDTGTRCGFGTATPTAFHANLAYDQQRAHAEIDIVLDRVIDHIMSALQCREADGEFLPRLHEIGERGIKSRSSDGKGMRDNSFVGDVKHDVADGNGALVKGNAILREGQTPSVLVITGGHSEGHTVVERVGPG